MLEVAPKEKNKQKESRFHEVGWAIFLSLAYFGLNYLLIGLRPEHVYTVLALNLVYFISPFTKRLILGHFLFIAYLILFDSMKAFPNYWVSPVHIQDLYEWEKACFGIWQNGVVLTPNEYLNLHTTAFLDVASGLFYLCWLPLPLVFGIYLFFYKKREFLHFYFAFFLVNLIGFAVYYTLPAAPPWYVQKFGFHLLMHTPGSAAGLLRFDDFFGIHLFQSMYTKSSNVFAAMPSLHSAYPLIVLYFGLKNRLGRINVLFATIVIGIWFAAIYTYHHYVWDVVAGILVALVGLVTFDFFLRKLPLVQKWLNAYQKAIS